MALEHTKLKKQAQNESHSDLFLSPPHTQCKEGLSEVPLSDKETTFQKKHESHQITREERGLRAIMALRQTIHLFFFGQFRNSLKFHPSPSLSLPPPPPFPLYEKWKASMANIHALLDASPFPPCLHTITGA
jgi:hypothetical protein